MPEQTSMISGGCEEKGIDMLVQSFELGCEFEEEA